jgi:hypothetical protein
MTMLSRIGGEFKTITGAKVFAGGAMRTIVAIKGFIDGAWRDLANFTVEPEVSGFTVSAPSSVSAVAALSSIQTDLVTLTPSGGLAPYTYAWTALGVTISRPSSASTRFTATQMQFEEEREVTATCVVNDALGSTVIVTIPITFQRV